MELNHRLLHVTQVSSPLDHGIFSDRGGSRTPVFSYRGPSLVPPSSVGGRALLASRPGRFAGVCVLGRSKWPVQVSHLAVGAYEAPLGAGPPASIVNQIAGPGIDPGIPAL